MVGFNAKTVCSNFRIIKLKIYIFPFSVVAQIHILHLFLNIIRAEVMLFSTMSLLKQFSDIKS